MPGLPHLRDVSNWQGPVDWPQERGEVVGAYTKVSQGITFVDPRAAERIKNATYAKVPIGGYHFATPGVGTPEQQADILCRLAPSHKGQLKPALDAESNPGHLNTGQLATWFLGFVLEVKRQRGYYPVIYGPPSFLQGWPVLHPEVFGLCPLWVADYGVRVPAIPPPWSHWAAWQWTDSFKDPAIGGTVDDSFCADLGALRIP